MILHTKIQGYILNWTTVASFGEGLANYIQNSAGISRNCDLVTATGMENFVLSGFPLPMVICSVFIFRGVLTVFFESGQDGVEEDLHTRIHWCTVANYGGCRNLLVGTCAAS
jgi:hypothetical protein